MTLLGRRLHLHEFLREVADKGRMMKEIKSGDTKMESGLDDDVRVRVYGDTAVVTAFGRERPAQGKDFIIRKGTRPCT